MAKRLMAPAITIDTSVSRPRSDSALTPNADRPQFLAPDCDERTRDSRPPTPLSMADDRSLRTLQAPVSPTAASLDGETLRSRSNSYSTQNRPFVDLNPAHALDPDPGNEADFVVSANPFAFSPGQLNKLLNPKSLAAYRALGGLSGLARGLRTDLHAGLSIDETVLPDSISFEDATGPNTAKHKTGAGATVDETVTHTGQISSGSRYESRLRVFKDNRLPHKKPTSVLRLMWLAYNDKILILLTIAAVVSLALGLYEALGQPASPGHPASVDWVEGVAICVAIIIVVLVGALNDWQKERQFLRLNQKKDDRLVKVLRSAELRLISVHDLTVGDVLHLEPGDLVPADGIFIAGHGLICDESAATGESDQIKKTAGELASAEIARGAPSSGLDPFVISGSKVLEGVGTCLVTSVGVNSTYGRTLLALQQASEPTPLQVKLNGLAGQIAKLGSAAALLLFAVLFVEFLAGLPRNGDAPALKARSFFDILIVAVTIIVVAVPEGLPLAVTLALAFATNRMLKENNLVRVLRSCETMGNATTVCSDKTGTLTQNKMTVVAGTIGARASFAQPELARSEEKPARPTRPVVQELCGPIKELLRQSIVLNSTAFEGDQDGVRSFIGSKTETALLLFARDHLGMDSVAVERAAANLVQLVPFDSARKCMGIVVRLSDGNFRLMVKGAAEILLARATDAVAESSKFAPTHLTDETRESLRRTIDAYAQNSLRTIALLYRDYSAWPPVGAKVMPDDKTQAVFDDVFHSMTFLGVFGIQDPLRPGVSESVRQCQAAGVTVRMVTGDSVGTAKAIAAACGITSDDGLVMEGPEFRRLPDAKMAEILPRLQVLARSSPEDKRTLVSQLKRLGETVAVTGDGTNDAPALKSADVGFSMGIAGTEVAKEASSIILMDDNFSSIVTALMWGRAVNDAVAKFLQFQITVNITAVLLAFVSAVSSPDRQSVLTAVQLLWVNLIMDTFAALALATDPPTPKILERKPATKRAPLISVNMWKMIIGQAVYQLAVTFVLYFAGAQLLGYRTADEREQLSTMVFNCFVWMQIFNELNCRRLDNKLNIFEGIQRNWIFIAINAVMIGGQILIMFVGGLAFQIVAIDGTQWAICIVCAFFCLPWAVVLRLVPDAAAEEVFHVFGSLRSALARAVTKTYQGIGEPLRRVCGRSQTSRPRSQPEMVEETGRSDEESAIPSGSTNTSTLVPPPITITTLA